MIIRDSAPILFMAALLHIIPLPAETEEKTEEKT